MFNTTTLAVIGAAAITYHLCRILFYIDRP